MVRRAHRQDDRGRLHCSDGMALAYPDAVAWTFDKAPNDYAPGVERAECRRSGRELGFEGCRLKRGLPERRNSMLHRVLREEAHQLRGRVRAPWVGT